jgi:hypothetical protein
LEWVLQPLMRPVRGYILRLMLAHLTCVGHVNAW